MTDQTKGSQNSLVAAYKEGVADFPKCFAKYADNSDARAAYLRGWHSVGDFFDEVRPDAKEVAEKRARLSAVNIGETLAATYKGD